MQLQRSNVVFDVDVIGGKKLKHILGDQSLSIFIKVKDVSVLRERLKFRNTEDDATLDMRVKKAAKEMKEEVHFDQVIVNDNLDLAISEVENMVKSFVSRS